MNNNTLKIKKFFGKYNFSFGTKEKFYCLHNIIEDNQNYNSNYTLKIKNELDYFEFKYSNFNTYDELEIFIILKNNEEILQTIKFKKISLDIHISYSFYEPLYEYKLSLLKRKDELIKNGKYNKTQINNFIKQIDEKDYLKREKQNNIFIEAKNKLLNLPQPNNNENLLSGKTIIEKEGYYEVYSKDTTDFDGPDWLTGRIYINKSNIHTFSN